MYRQRRPGGWEAWVWRVTLTGYLLACAATFLDYWTHWAGDYNVLFEVGWIVAVPTLVLTLAGSTVLGVTLLVRSSAPRLPALLLALAIPLALLITQVTALGKCGAAGDVRIRHHRAPAGFGLGDPAACLDRCSPLVSVGCEIGAARLTATSRTRAGIAYDRAGPRGEVPVVLLHAGVADRRIWDLQWLALTAERDVLRLDLRGFSGSVVRPRGVLSPVGDVLETLAEVGIDSCHLVGASLGAGRGR